MSFTQSNLDKVLNGLFGLDKITELSLCTNPVEWAAWCNGPILGMGATPAEAIRNATAALVAKRLAG